MTFQTGKTRGILLSLLAFIETTNIISFRALVIKASSQVCLCGSGMSSLFTVLMFILRNTCFICIYYWPCVASFCWFSDICSSVRVWDRLSRGPDPPSSSSHISCCSCFTKANIAQIPQTFVKHDSNSCTCCSAVSVFYIFKYHIHVFLRVKHTHRHYVYIIIMLQWFLMIFRFKQIIHQSVSSSLSINEKSQIARLLIFHTLCASSDLALESNPSDHARASTIFLSKSQTDGE